MDSLKSLIVLLLLIVITSSSFSQTGDDDNTRTAIDFSFNTPKFSKVFPFDQKFTINFKDILPTVNYIKVSISEDLPVRGRIAPGSVITPTSFAANRITYLLSDWERPTGSTVTSAELPVIYELRPGVDYTVIVEAGSKSAITGAALTSLQAGLAADVDVKAIVSTVSKNTLANPAAGNAELNVTLEQFTAAAIVAVKKVDPNYIIGTINYAGLLSTMSVYVQDIRDLLDLLEDLENDGGIKAMLNYAAIRTDIHSLRSQLTVIDWGTVAAGDPAFTDLMTTKDAIFTKIAANSANVLSTVDTQKKTDLESLLNGAVTDRDTWLNNIASTVISPVTTRYNSIVPTYRLDFAKNAKFYITLDAGISYIWRMDRAIIYSGVNIYSRPINKNLSPYHYHGWERVKVMTSLLIGINVTSIEKANVRKGLFGNTAPVLGLGFRILPLLKINAGCMAYYTYANNPVLTTQSYRMTFSPFVSFAIDMDAKTLFGGIGDAILK